MSLPEQEAEALRRAEDLLIRIGSGQYRVDSIRRLRADARAVLNHYPLDAAGRWTEAYGDKPEHRRTATRDEEDT